jgi:DNA-cytosine methyltransferase
LFSGVGGFSSGFRKAGYNIVLANEIDESIAESYSKNHPETLMINDDIKNILPKIKEYQGKVDVIIGGPPCQGFSLAGNIGRKFLDDDRNRLFLEYVRFVRILKPKMFVIENVAAMEKHNKGKTIEEIKGEIKKLGYNVVSKVLNSVHYNVPQERRRIFIIGYQDEYNFTYPIESNDILTIKDAIDDLPVLESGQKSNIDLHYAMHHSAQMLEKMKYVKDGGNRLDIPENLRPTSGDIRKYIRYDSKKPSVCITGDMRKIFHYSQNRALTCRELARIQTFPDSYRFFGSSIQIQQQIGNAVPPKLAYAVALSIKKGLKK